MVFGALVELDGASDPLGRTPNLSTKRQEALVLLPRESMTIFSISSVKRSRAVFSTRSRLGVEADGGARVGLALLDHLLPLRRTR